MHSWGIVIGAVLATAVISAAFWLAVMPRVAQRALSRRVAFVVLLTFGLLLLAVPAAGLLLLKERSVPLVCALIVGWAAAVRGVGWVLARKFFVPRLRQTAPPSDTDEPSA